MMRKILLSIISLLIAISLQAQGTKKQVKLLDDYIQDAIKLWEPPGLVVAVVKDGEIVFSKGYGTRTFSEDRPVDNNTLFMIGSTTKAFTSASLAILADEGKLRWDDKVIDYLPKFQLKDPYVTREITIRDLLTHRTGIGNTDYLWSFMTISGDSALYEMRKAEQAYSLRSSFIYQNLMYLAAGRIVEVASGQSWESFLQERLYKPIGMSSSFPLYQMVRNIDNKADAHLKIDGVITKIDQLVADEIAPAGSMWASIDDMAKWTQFLLNDAIVNDDTLISPKNFNELFKPQQIVPENQFYPTQMLTHPHWTTYGLGWFQHDYRGKMVQFHTGSLPGMVAIIGMIPDENIGVYVMGNLDHVELRHAIMYTTFDLFMDGKITTDWSRELKKLYDSLSGSGVNDPERKENTNASLVNITGKYVHAKYGTIEVAKKGKDFKFTLNKKIMGSMERWHYDVYQITFDNIAYGKSMASFRMNSEGKVSYLEIFGEQFTYQPTEN